MDFAPLLPLSALAVGHGVLAYVKAKEHGAACAAHGAEVRPFVRVQPAMRAGLAFSAVAGCGLAQTCGEELLAAGFLSLSVALTSFGPPTAARRCRGPGEWCRLHDDFRVDAGERPDRFDLRGPKGRALAACAVGFVAVVALVAQRLSSAGLLALSDALPLLPLWLTGRPSQLPKEPVLAASPWLLSLRDRLGARGVQATLIGRRPLGRANIDEVRLSLKSDTTVVGFGSIEIGVATGSDRRGFSPEMLVRVVFGSPASLRLHASRRYGRALPGRTADERVFSVPTSANEDEACEAVLCILAELRERRTAPTPFRGEERRGALADDSFGGLLIALVNNPG